MRLKVDMNQTYGDYDVPQYKVTVWNGGDAVRAKFENVDSVGAWPKGGMLTIPPETARMLGHALLAAAAGPVSTEFTVKE